MCVCVCVCMYIYLPASEIVRFALQFATQNCLGCYLKWNLGSKFHDEVATHLPRIKSRTLYTLSLRYNNCNSMAKN